MAIRRNPDGSIIVGIIPEEQEKPKKATPAPEGEKPKAKKPTKKKD